MNRVAASTLAFSLAGFAGLAGHEYYTAQAVIPVKGDRPTVGLGSTFRDDGTPVQPGDTITPVQAIQRSAKHIAKDETKLKDCVTAPVFQHEYDTMVDHAYQYGVMATCTSQVVKLTNQGKYAEACQAYLNFKFITAPVSYGRGWEAFKFDAAGKPIRYRFDCTTPGNKVCAGVGKRSLHRASTCMEGH